MAEAAFDGTDAWREGYQQRRLDEEIEDELGAKMLDSSSKLQSDFAQAITAASQAGIDLSQFETVGNSTIA